MAEYFTSRGGRFGNLWKKEGSDEYFFSLKKLEWIKCKWVCIQPDFGECSEEYAENFIEDEKKRGPYQEEILPINFYMNDFDSIYASNVIGDEFYVFKGGEDLLLLPASVGTIDPYWGGIAESQLDSYLEEYTGDKETIPYTHLLK